MRSGLACGRRGLLRRGIGCGQRKLLLRSLRGLRGGKHPARIGLLRKDVGRQCQKREAGDANCRKKAGT